MGLSFVTFWDLARRKAAQNNVSLRSVLEAIAFKQWDSVSAGAMILRTSEAGASIEFDAGGTRPDDLANFASRALKYLETQADESNPVAPRHIRRFRVVFNRTQP